MMMMILKITVQDSKRSSCVKSRNGSALGSFTLMDAGDLLGSLRTEDFLKHMLQVTTSRDFSISVRKQVQSCVTL